MVFHQVEFPAKNQFFFWNSSDIASMLLREYKFTYIETPSSKNKFSLEHPPMPEEETDLVASTHAATP
jgi:hypothetical protein